MSKFNIEQDFTNVVWEKKLPNSKLPKTTQLRTNYRLDNPTKLEKIIYDDGKISADDIKPIVISSELSIEIRKKRLALNLTQDSLARQLSWNIALVKEFENGTAIRNGKHISQIKKFLGINKTTT
jgi:ribosome-binding protein aMBF1 (putative translation factor)